MKEIAADLVARCRARGALAAEAYVKIGERRAVEMNPDGIVSWTRSAEGGIGLRVLREGGATGFASICGPRPGDDALDHLVMAAMDAARATDTVFVLPGQGPARDGRGLGIFDPRLHAATPADLEGLLGDAAREALRADPRVRRLDAASLAVSSTRVLMRNSEGFEGEYRQTLVNLSLGAVAQDAGRSIVVRQSRTARSLSAFSPALFGDQTARLALTALEGSAMKGCMTPALLAPAAAAEVLRHFARSVLLGNAAPGELVAAPVLTIIDDGHLPGGAASAPFDGEGVATRRTVVVSRRMLTGPIHDLRSAARHNAASTGNGIRMSFREPPRRSTSNLFIAPGSDEPADLMAGLRDGIHVETLRPTTALRGDPGLFAGIATGRRVVAGLPQEAVAGALLVAPLSDLLQGVTGVGNDLTFGFPGGSFAAPSLLVKEVEIRAPWA